MNEFITIYTRGVSAALYKPGKIYAADLPVGQAQAFFATCPKGLEGLLASELEELGSEKVRETIAGVHFCGDISVAYTSCLWSRFANKVLMPLSRFEVRHADDLYEGVREIDWQQHLSPKGSLLVDFTGSNSGIRHTQFAALKVKDAIVDNLRDLFGERPSVDKHDPHLRINARLNKDTVVVSLDLSGASLHRRGYRVVQGAAPLKENLAAAVLRRADWPQIAVKGGALIDPMCGSGTLLVEAAMMAADIAPGLLRTGFGFERWLQHRCELWSDIRGAAVARREHGLSQWRNDIRGYDADANAVRGAQANIVRAGLDKWIRIVNKPLQALTKPSHKPSAPGLVIANPPYGERLGETQALAGLYQQLGNRLKTEFAQWQAGVLTANPDLGKQIRLRARKKYKLFNGMLPSELLLFDIDTETLMRKSALALQQNQTSIPIPTPGTQMVINRLRKNLKSLAPWVDREGIDCYRVYDADMPEYAAAVDVYAGCAHVQEYVAPKTVDESKAQARLEELVTAVSMALNIARENISIKQRRRNRGKQQYEKLVDNENHPEIVVREGGAKFYVDLWRYLDSGLFLDHRLVRRRIVSLAGGKHLLNLFCYTAATTVQAALGGALSSVSVDMSKTYLQWARRNFSLNKINENDHRLINADCLAWLQNCTETFDVILLDPPSFSNSKRMQGILDIQRDHVKLICRCMALLNPAGSVVFSTNLRRFTLDGKALSAFVVEDISAQTIDRDFQRNSKIHQCWTITSRTHLKDTPPC